MSMTLVKFYDEILGWPKRKVKSLVIVPKVFGALSFLGSSYVVCDVLRDPKKRKSPYHRIMVGMSILDMSSSFFGPFLGTWVMPRNYHLYAVGTVRSCDVAGFFHQLGMNGTPLYNCSLVTFYLLLLKFNWTDRKVSKVEKYFHIVPLGWCISLAFAAIPFKLYGATSYSCWITASYPMGCDDPDSQDSCIRGQGDAYLTFWGIFMIMSVPCLVYVGVTMFIIYRNVLHIERQAEKFRFVPRFQKDEAKKDRDRSRRIMIQGIKYSLTLFLVWTPMIVFYTVWRIRGPTYYAYMLNATFFPMQGIFNCMIYLTPHRTEEDKKGRKQSKKMKNPLLKRILKGKKEELPHNLMMSSKTTSTQNSLSLKMIEENRNSTTTSKALRDSFTHGLDGKAPDNNLIMENVQEDEEEKTEIEAVRNVVHCNFEEDHELVNSHLRKY